MSNLIYYFCHFISIICFFLCYIDSDKKEKEIEGKFERNELVTLKFNSGIIRKFFKKTKLNIKKKFLSTKRKKKRKKKIMPETNALFHELTLSLQICALHSFIELKLFIIERARYNFLIVFLLGKIYNFLGILLIFQVFVYIILRTSAERGQGEVSSQGLSEYDRRTS